MRHGAQTFLRDQFAGLTTDAVCLVLNAHQCSLQMLYEFHLSLGKLSRCFFTKCARTLFESLERRRRVGGVVTLGIVDIGTQQIIITLRLLEFFKDQLLELLKFFVGVTFFLTHFDKFFLSV